jgi:hypothetical protein
LTGNLDIPSRINSISTPINATLIFQRPPLQPVFEAAVQSLAKSPVKLCCLLIVIVYDHSVEEDFYKTRRDTVLALNVWEVRVPVRLLVCVHMSRDSKFVYLARDCYDTPRRGHGRSIFSCLSTEHIKNVRRLAEALSFIELGDMGTYDLFNLGSYGGVAAKGQLRKALGVGSHIVSNMFGTWQVPAALSATEEKILTEVFSPSQSMSPKVSWDESPDEAASAAGRIDMENQPGEAVAKKCDGV